MSGWNVDDPRRTHGAGGLAPVSRPIDRHAPYARIATEEAWNIPEILAAQVRLLESPSAPDDTSLRMAGMFSKMAGLQEQLMDIGAARLARMDELGVARQLLLLTAPGVQVLEPAEGSALARLANDRLAEVCRRYPERFSGLTVFQPQDIKGAVAEIERGMTTLGLNGAVINSHFRGHYLDELAYWPILEVLEAHDAALYIHPTIPPKEWSHPYELRGFGGALAGFSHEVWMHTMGLIFSGAFDRFPKLRLVIGHMGEGLPLLLYRFDWMQSNADGKPGLRDGAPAVKLQHKVSHYFKTNIWITTSGQGWEPAVKYCMDVLGPDRVLYAMDYPYQQSADEVAAYDAFNISAEHKKMLMQTNAETVFRIGK